MGERRLRRTLPQWKKHRGKCKIVKNCLSDDKHARKVWHKVHVYTMYRHYRQKKKLKTKKVATLKINFYVQNFKCTFLFTSQQVVPYIYIHPHTYTHTHMYTYTYTYMYRYILVNRTLLNVMDCLEFIVILHKT